ncbi:MAG: ABC transporter substrate-binding protein [Candidatus Heimdallarchaeota archaeon]|nr:ABC transporter substrate-binding protein [Candidatus Heimdallarchaeota archaeon]
MKSKIAMNSIVFLIVFSMVATPTVTNATAPHELTLGGLFPLTGDLTMGGVEREAAFRIAIEEINTHTTLLPNTELKYEVRDTQTIASIGENAAEELINLGVFGLVGAASSSVSAAIAEKAETAKVPQISYSSTSPTLSNKTKFPYFLRVVPPDSIQSVAIGNIVNKMGWDTVTTLSTNDDYGQSGIDVFKTTAADFGIEVLSPQEFSAGATNVKVQLQSIVDSKAKIIVANMIMADAVTVFSQAASVGITRESGYIWVGTDGITQEQVFEGSLEVETAMTGMIGTRPIRGVGTIYEAFLDTWENADPNEYAGSGDREPNSYSTFAYDAVYAFAYAAQKMINAGTDPEDGELLLSELQGLSFDGATGTVSFDENGDRLGVYDIVNLVDGVFVVVGTWDVMNGMDLTGTIIWPDGSTDTPADGSGIPGFEFLLAIAGMFSLIPILRRRK